MLKHIDEYNKYLEITGFRGVKIVDAKAFLETVRSKLPYGCEIQLFDADVVATWQHPYFAVLNALVAFETKRNLSNSLAVESMLYVSAQRQITKAIAKVGVKPHSVNVVAIILSGNAGLAESGFKAITNMLGAPPDESVLELSERKINRLRRVFEISDEELEAVSSKGDEKQAITELIIERVALLSTKL
jgi:tRNA threonylcarbamoyladenosine modification (KEOPS) complex Cgi121 subunit